MTKFSTRPLYLQLHDAMTQRVAGGQWKPGPIANEGDLAREFGVSTGTVRKALDLMEVERLITRRQGRGTFVNDQTTRDLSSRFCNIRTLDGRPVFPQFRVERVTEAQANEVERGRRWHVSRPPNYSRCGAEVGGSCEHASVSTTAALKLVFDLFP